MKKAALFLMSLAFLAGPAFSGVVKKTSSDINFKGFGRFTTVQSQKLTAQRTWTDSQNNFKGKGLLGGLAGKAVLRSGDFSELTDLPALSVYRIDAKKKEYTVSPIKKITEEEGGDKGEKAEEGEKPAESDIRIVKNEFKVDATGESKDINGFPTKQFLIRWVLDWENVRTGEKGTNRLETEIWATPYSDVIRKALDEEQKYFREYMKAIGLDQDKLQQDMLGSSWLSILNGLNAAKGRPSASADAAKAAGEMKKIQGYPVVIDGQYFATSVSPQGEAEEGSGGGKGGLLGGLAKKAFKKKPAEDAAAEPSLAYRIELQELSLVDLSDADFQIPEGYKKKG
ncbi:MAG: hypothetical protein ACYDH0_07240 [Candidatus Aminicenantales bacterium]